MGQNSSSFISIRQAAAIAPVRVAESTVYNWVAVGIRGVDGNSIRLKSFQIGGRVFTSKTWLDDFFEQVERDVAARRNKRGVTTPA